MVICQRRHVPLRLAAGAQYWAENVPWSFRDLKQKPSYDARRTMRYNLQDYMSSVIPFKAYSGKKVLEIGCGAGLDAAEFARNGALVTAVDFTDTAVKETLTTFEEANLSGVVKQMDARKLAFDAGSPVLRPVPPKRKPSK